MSLFFSLSPSMNSEKSSIASKDVFNTESASESATSLSPNDKVLKNIPMKCRNGIVSYNNIEKDLDPDSFIYYDQKILKLKDIDQLEGPLYDYSNNLLNKITSLPTTIETSNAIGYDVVPTTDGNGKNSMLKIVVSSTVNTSTDNLLSNILSTHTQINGGVSGTLNNLQTTTSGLGSGCVLSITTDGVSVTSITATSAGSGYCNGDLLIVDSSLINSSKNLTILLTNTNLVSSNSNIDFVKVTDEGIGYKTGDRLIISSSDINSNTNLEFTLQEDDIVAARDI